MELAGLSLDSIIEEVEDVGFELSGRFYKKCLHNYSYNNCVVLNFVPDKQN